MWRRPHRHSPPLGRSRGQSLVELALILPIFLLLIAGAVDLGRLFYAYVAIVDASKDEVIRLLLIAVVAGDVSTDGIGLKQRKGTIQAKYQG